MVWIRITLSLAICWLSCLGGTSALLGKVIQDQVSETKIENPYICPEHWDKDRILDFLQSSEDKPRSIRRRTDFVRAVENAADRLLANEAAIKPSWTRIALLTKSRALHYHASWGNKDSDSRLKKAIADFADREGKAFEREAEFYQLERQLVEFGTSPGADPDPVQATALLDQAFSFCEKQILVDRHLRLASNVVRVANLIDTADQEKTDDFLAKREKEFVRFGKLFEASADLKLSRYGKSLALPPEAGGDLVGKTIELVGAGLDDEKIDINDLRGNIVVVDFWATWCGPCIREIPELIKLSDELESGGLKVIGVNLDDDLGDVKEFVEEKDLFWPNMIGDDASDIAKKYGVRAIPTMMLIDQAGKIVAVKNSVGDIASLARELVESQSKK